MGNEHRAFTDYADFARDVKRGDFVLLADGRVRLEVLDSDGESVRCKVVTGGPVTDRKGINLPGIKVTTPSLTEKDLVDLALGLEQGLDFIALSFVRDAEEVLRLRKVLQEKNVTTRIISKIEKPEGWENLDAILEESDGIMVARGDLGVEMAPEEVPFLQKSIIERARQKGKIVITATQMLESMIENPFPTRAEASDIANAIYDGTDAVMLSGETSVGKFPVEAARMMASIVLETESNRQFRTYKDLGVDYSASYPEVIASAAFQASHTAGVAAIAVFTTTGETARLVSRFRPSVPIYAFTPSPEVARQLLFSYGVHPVFSGFLNSTDQMLAVVERTLLSRGLLGPGDGVVIVAGQPIGKSGATNLLKLHRV